jgi:hypothetical protein
VVAALAFSIQLIRDQWQPELTILVAIFLLISFFGSCKLVTRGPDHWCGKPVPALASRRF